MKAIFKLNRLGLLVALAWGLAPTAHGAVFVQCPGDTNQDAVIDSPDPVSRVRPPTAIITTTSANSAISQTRIAPRAP